MSTDDKRAILERIAQGTISMDEAEQELARLDDPARPRTDPAPTRVLPAHDSDGVFEVQGRLGDDGLHVVPADADLTLRANGGSLSLSGTRGSLDAELNVGRAVIRAAFTRGQSRIDANVGKLHIGLHPDSNVRIQVASATSIRVSDGLVKTGRGQWAYGNGDAGLELSGNISRVVVDLDVDVDVEMDEGSVGVELTDASAS